MYSLLYCLSVVSNEGVAGEVDTVCVVGIVGGDLKFQIKEPELPTVLLVTLSIHP